MILKGYPRISETFISNEILLLESMDIRVRIFSMRHPRESFSHKSVQQIRAQVDYLPTELYDDFNSLLLAATLQGVRQPVRFRAALRKASERFARTRSMGTSKHLLQVGYLAKLVITCTGYNKDYLQQLAPGSCQSFRRPDDWPGNLRLSCRAGSYDLGHQSTAKPLDLPPSAAHGTGSAGTTKNNRSAAQQPG